MSEKPKVFVACDCVDVVEKGQQIFVEGSLRQDTWQDKETKQNRSRLFVKANSWQFVQYKATEAARAAAQNHTPEVSR